MRKRFRWDKKYLYWGVTAFLVVAAAIVFYMALHYLPQLKNALGELAKILSPFIWGLIITYLLVPMMRSFERSMFAPLGEKLYKKQPEKAKRFARGLSVLLAELTLVAIIVALVYLILPQLYASLQTIVANSNVYLDNIIKWTNGVLSDFPGIEQYALRALGSVNDSLMGWMQSTLLPEIGGLVTNLTAGVYYVIIGVYNLLIGIIVSVYILGNLESCAAGGRRVLYSIFSVDAAEKIREGIAFTNRTFIGFINGKILDSAIIGLICYIVCVILNMPFSLLVSVIVGVTNIIPFFGPFIGGIPSAIIIFMVAPIKGLIFGVFIIILQQIDGNIIGPKILGNSVGINGFWVMFSIIIGAGIFGFWGMLLGVPVFVVIYTAINAAIDKKLKRSDLPWEAADYMDLDHIDPVTLEVFKKPKENQE